MMMLIWVLYFNQFPMLPAKNNCSALGWGFKNKLFILVHQVLFLFIAIHHLRGRDFCRGSIPALSFILILPIFYFLPFGRYNPGMVHVPFRFIFFEGNIIFLLFSISIYLDIVRLCLKKKVKLGYEYLDYRRWKHGYYLRP